MKKEIIATLFFLIACAVLAHAQGISVSAPSSVATGENFRISYTIQDQNVDDFRAGNIPSGLEVIAGPYTSRQSSYQVVNGHTSSSSSVTFTYTLYADKPGTYTIPAAHAKIGGKSLSSHAVRIAVSGSARSNSGAARMHEDAAPEMRSAGSPITGNDLFVKVSANKRRVHEQEPILLTYKVYTLVDLTQLDGKMPDLTGFHTQEVQLPQQKSFHLEKLNGRNYRCVTWSQYVMYPQMTGKLTIPSITFKGIVVQQNRSVDPFEAFFNGGSGYVEVKRNIVAPGMDIQVDPLPAKPANFSGGVGRFTISAQLNKTTVKAGNPVTLRVVVGGTGNLKLIKQPVVAFPKDFDKYDPKVTDKTRLTANGIEGNMIYDFMFVPRNQGDYTIPAVSLTYYDTASESYRTVSTQPISVKVEKGDGSKATVDDYSDNQPTDIKTIKQGAASFVSGDSMFFGSKSYWMCIIIPVILFVVVVLVFRKRAIDNADVIGRKGKRASKVATKRLKTAYKLMKANRQDAFYDEVLKAMWGYVGDKMNIPVERLSRDNISDNLVANSISTETIAKFINALDECEFERYAPGDAAGNMAKTYNSAMVAIMDIEESMKTSKGKKKVNDGVTAVTLLMLVMAFAFCSVSASAITKDNADAEYNKGNYMQASIDYKDLLKQGESAELYYNLGNCYYRMGNITQSLIAYERAQRLSPGDGDVRYNLDFVRSKTIDRVAPADEMFFVEWYASLRNMFGMDGWARVSVVALIAVLLLVLLFWLGRGVALRKTGFYGAIVACVVLVVSIVFAVQQKSIFDSRDKAIVVSPTVNVKKTPADSGNDAFIIHEGTRVTIIDRTMKEWRSVRLDDGREGWLKTRQIEVI